MTLGSVLAFGFLIGLRHAMEADHLAAVATLATRQSSLGRTVLQGAAWGVGHTLTLGLVGGFILVLGATIPENVASRLELGVGAMLALLGADVLWRLARERVHFHAHRHGADAHFHAHSHAQGPAHDGHSHRGWRAWPTRAVCVGMVHGMAGSAALVLVALDRASSIAQGLAFIAVFGLGSIAGMALLSMAIALPLLATAGRLRSAHRGLGVAVGLSSLALGLHIVATQLPGAL